MRLPRFVRRHALAGLLAGGVGLAAWALGAGAPDRPPAAIAAMADEALPADPLDASVWDVHHGIGHLKVAAKSGSPLLLQEAEREILLGLFAGLETARAGVGLDRDRYARVYQAYDDAQGVFKDLPYRLVVEPGHGQRGFELPLRRHPWLVDMDRPVAGWRAELIESGVRLTPD